MMVPGSVQIVVHFLIFFLFTFHSHKVNIGLVDISLSLKLRGGEAGWSWGVWAEFTAGVQEERCCQRGRAGVGVDPSGR